MKRRGILSAILAVGLAGCYGQVVLSQAETSPKGDVRLAVVYRARPGSSFSDTDQKTVNVNVSVTGRTSSQPPIYLFARQYTVVAADVDWKIEWMSPDHGKIDFVSYPPGVSKYDIPEAERATRATPLGSLEVRRSLGTEEFELTKEEWSIPYQAKDYPRGSPKWW